MIDHLSVAAAKLLLSILYGQPMTFSSRKRQRALRELEERGWIRVTRRPPKPALIRLLHCPPGDRPISDSDLIRLDKETNVLIYSNLSNRSIDLAPTEHDEPEPVTPGLTSLLRQPLTQSTATDSDAVTPSTSDAATASDALTATVNDATTVGDAVTTTISDAIEAADRMPVNTSEGYGVKSSFWRRRAAQINALEEAWVEFWPNVPLTADMVRKYLRITGDRAMPAYEMFVRASKAKKPIEYPATYIEKALEREKQAKPPAENFRRDYEEPYDGELEEETPEERAERLARAKRLAYLFEPKGVDGE